MRRKEPAKFKMVAKRGGHAGVLILESNFSMLVGVTGKLLLSPITSVKPRKRVFIH